MPVYDQEVQLVLKEVEWLLHHALGWSCWLPHHKLDHNTRWQPSQQIGSTYQAPSSPYQAPRSPKLPISVPTITSEDLSPPASINPTKLGSCTVDCRRCLAQVHKDCIGVLCEINLLYWIRANVLLTRS